MICKITDGATLYYIADGVGRVYQSLQTLGISLNQDTQVEQPLRAAFPIAFPSRASQTYSFDLPVVFPPCATLADAFIQTFDVPAQCPRGGMLTLQLGSAQRSYSQAWIKSIKPTPMGLTNLFTFTIDAVNPSTATLSPLALMDARYIANLSAITGLTGGGSTNLDGLVTLDVAVGFTAFVDATIAGIAQPKHFKLIAGTTATNTDPTAGALIVRPADYNASTNAKIWTEL